jgi:hypothetical protein
MWVACQNNRLHDAQAHIDRTPVHLLDGPFQDRILNIVRRARHDDYGVIRSNNLFRVYFPDSAGASFMAPIGTVYTPCLRAAKGDRGCRDDVPIKAVL